MGRSRKAQGGVETVHLRDCVVDLYLGRIRANEIAAKYPGVSRRTATELAAKLGAGLIQTDQQLQATRAASAAVRLGGPAQLGALRQRQRAPFPFF